MATYNTTIGLIGNNCGASDYPVDSSPLSVFFGDTVVITVGPVLLTRVGGIGYVAAASGGVYTTAQANDYSDTNLVSRVFTFTAPSTAGTYHVYFFGQTPPADAACWKNRRTIVVSSPAVAPTPPTSISIAANPNQQEAVVPCQVTASGGNGEAIQVSVDNVDWAANGSTFPENSTTYTRGTNYTFYARSYNASSGLYSSAFSQVLALPYLDNQDLTINTSHVANVASNIDTGSISFSSGNITTAYSLVRSTDNVWTSATTLGANDLAFSLVNGPSATYNLSGAGFPPAGSTYYYRFRARLRSIYGGSGTDSAYEWCTLNGTTATTLSITRAAVSVDTKPDDFELGGPIPGAAFDTPYYSNTITVAGLEAGVSTYISISGTGSPQYSKNSGAYVSTNGTVVNGDTVTVRVTSPNTSDASSIADLDIGTTTDDFTVSTSAAATGGETVVPSVTGGDYGLMVYSAGQGLILSPANRHINIVNSGTVPLPANGTSAAIDFEGMTPTNTSDAIVYFPVGIYDAFIISVNRGNGSFTLTNNNNVAGSVSFVALRVG